MYTLGKRLDLILTSRNMTRRELARRVNKSEHTIGRICNDQIEPRHSTILEISRELGINPYFLKGECFKYEPEEVLDYYYHLTPIQQEWLNNNIEVVNKFWPLPLQGILKLFNADKELKQYLIKLVMSSSLSVEEFLKGSKQARYGTGIPSTYSLLNSRYDYDIHYNHLQDGVSDLEVELEKNPEKKKELMLRKFKSEYTHMVEHLGKFKQMYESTDQILLVGESFPEPVNATELTWTNILKTVRILDDEVWEVIIGLSLIVFDYDKYESLLELIRKVL